MYLILKKNGALEILDHNRESFVEIGADVSIKHEAVTEIEPHQLYIIMITKAGSRRLPSGMYKVAGNKLIIRRDAEYRRTIGGIPVGPSRDEMPKDFNGVVEVFEKL